MSQSPKITGQSFVVPSGKSLRIDYMKPEGAVDHLTMPMLMGHVNTRIEDGGVECGSPGPMSVSG